LSEEIIKDAELAMYHSKRIGGDRIDVYKPAMRARKTDRLALESELRRAIEREEITILYQPIVRLEDRSIAGFEALARWDHPKLGRMSPSEFISIAEEIGLIVELGLFVMDTTAKQLAIWQRTVRAREPIFASVNVSSRQLLRHDLIHDVRGVLSRSAVARGSLKLELTESLVMENRNTRRRCCTGSRNSASASRWTISAPAIHRWPICSVSRSTPSRSTSRSCASSRGARPVLLKSIIALAHDLNMAVVAEGAETDSDAVELFQLGCEYAQGFAFGEPVDADATIRLLTGEKVPQPRNRRQSARNILKPSAAAATTPASVPGPETA
jgi:EAL domain-containing protein (putative c-di-GMP-specific phosphodiesterase class I)